VERKDERVEPDLTSPLQPMPGARTSHPPSSPSAFVQPASSLDQPSSAVAPFPHFHTLSPPHSASGSPASSAEGPQAAQTVQSAETSLTPTFERRTNRLRWASKGGASGGSVDGEGWSIRNDRETGSL